MGNITRINRINHNRLLNKILRRTNTTNNNEMNNLGQEWESLPFSKVSLMEIWTI